MNDHDGDVLGRMRDAFDLYEFSEEVMRQNLRRRNPEASEEAIEELFQQWLLERPGAEHGDASGPDFRVRHLDR